jgi:hypothetical protein
MDHGPGHPGPKEKPYPQNNQSKKGQRCGSEFKHSTAKKKKKRVQFSINVKYYYFSYNFTSHQAF